jgi:hypothetical protein
VEAAVTADARHVATQRAGVRGIAFELGLFVVYLAVAPAMSRAPGGLVLWLVIAAGGLLVRIGLFSGPQHRGVEVTRTQVRSGWFALPLRDIVGVEVMDRRELRRRSLADEVANESVPPGPTEAVVVSLVSPEGVPYAFGAAVDDAAGLADAIDRARVAAPRAVDDVVSEPRPVDVRQGVDRKLAGGVLAVVLVFDVLWVVFNGWYAGATVLASLVVLRSARRRVVVDDVGLTSGRFTVRWEDVERVRVAPTDEVRLLPTRRTLLPLWAPPWTLVVVRRAPGDAPARQRTLLVGVPGPIDVRRVLDRAG